MSCLKKRALFEKGAGGGLTEEKIARFQCVKYTKIDKKSLYTLQAWWHLFQASVLSIFCQIKPRGPSGLKRPRRTLTTLFTLISSHTEINFDVLTSCELLQYSMSCNYAVCCYYLHSPNIKPIIQYRTVLQCCQS